MNDQKAQNSLSLIEGLENECENFHYFVLSF